MLLSGKFIPMIMWKQEHDHGNKIWSIKIWREKIDTVKQSELYIILFYLSIIEASEKSFTS